MSYNGKVYEVWLRERYHSASPVPKILLDEFDSAESVYYAEPEEILQRCALKKSDIAPLSGKSLESAKRIDSYCFQSGIGILGYRDASYPSRLRAIDTAPAVLFWRGALPNLDDHVLIASVGTRKMSDYGRMTAHRFSFEMASAGAVIVSGMAEGIDSMSHKGAIDADGITIAVLGSGIDVLYPKSNAYLFSRILESGIVMTEYLPGEEPERMHFPKRNRIIAALSLATVVIEADIGSGALITARYAREYGRSLFSVPGPVNSKKSRATNMLIKEGIPMACEAYDVLSEFELEYPHRIKIENIRRKNYFIGNWNYKDETFQRDPSVSETENESALQNEGAEDRTPVSREGELEGNEQKLYIKILKHSPVTAEELSDGSIAFSEVMTALTMLEIGGYIEALPGGVYQIKKE